MIKTILTASALSVLTLLTFVYSQGPAAGPRPGMGQGMMDSTRHAKMMGKPMMMGGMMGGMMGHSLVATADGGVVLMMGNRLYKYDKNLAAIKDVEVKIDTASLRKWRETMQSLKD